MPEGDKSLDVVGVGKLAEAIPEKGWEKLIDTACSTFSELVAPITQTTAGLGGLIQGKFDSMIDTQKVFAADALSSAKAKVEKTGRSTAERPKAKVLIPAIENASLETDDGLRDIWANLLANEMLDGGVHPEFPRVLSRLSSNDAVVLAEIASDNQKDNIKIAAEALNVSIKFFGIKLEQLLDEPADFSREYLKNLNLITKVHGKWVLSYFGEEFVKSVTDPNFGN